MFSHAAILFAFCAYVLALYVVASWLERNRARPGSLARAVGRSPWLYVLAFTVFNTTWTVYGVTGTATSRGMLCVAFYLGPTLMLLVFWPLLRRLIRVKNTYRITSIADLISSRYGRSQSIAALVTIMALTCVIPYIALQLKAMIDTVAMLHSGSAIATSGVVTWFGPVIALLMIVFTILFGLRRLDPTERHPGMLGAFAVEGLIKLVAVLIAGVAITSIAFGDPVSAVERLADAPPRHIAFFGPMTGEETLNWLAFLICAASAVFFLPRQFHIAVVENESPRHLRRLLWGVPLYFLLISVFAVPIAIAGMHQYPDIPGDQLVLGIPLQEGRPVLAMTIFIGGIAAGTGMVMASTMTVTTMISNHLLVPVLDRVRALGGLRRHLLVCRWIIAGAVISLGYGYVVLLGQSQALTGIGMIAFLATLPLAVPIIGGLTWRRGNKAGALLGLGGGYLAWIVTAIAPLLIRAGFLGDARGRVWGVDPANIASVGGAGWIPHAVFWILLLGVGGYLLGSLAIRDTREEVNLREEFMAVSIGEPVTVLDLARHGHADISSRDKYAEVLSLLTDYMPRDEATRRTDDCFAAAQITRDATMTAAQLAELHAQLQRSLAGVVGSASAHAAIRRRMSVSSEEARGLSEVYAGMVAELHISPMELKRRIDYYRERESLLSEQEDQLRALNAELERRVEQRTGELVALQQQMMQAARSAGMAEVATGVLHSVGNVLNSINISSELVSQLVRESRATRVSDVAALLAEHADELGAFLTANERGKQILPYLKQLATIVDRERDDVLREVANLQKSVNHITRVVSKQQAYAKSAGLIEPCQPAEIVADALVLVRESFEKSGIAISVDDDSGQIDPIVPILLDRHKVLQILINLIGNARDALCASDRPDRRLSIRTRLTGADHLCIEVADNGIGIADAARPHIFQHGFTTKPTGHGFGLHNSAVAAQEMGGRLAFESDGVGTGATFILELPVTRPSQPA